MVPRLTVQPFPIPLPPASAALPRSLAMLLAVADDCTRPVKPEVVEAFVGLAAVEGWNPQALVTADESVLEWLARHPRGAAEAYQGTWPLEPEGFEGLDAPRDTEWLVALMVASGASPWQLYAQPMAPALAWAFQNARWALAEQMLRLPQAPSLRDVLESSDGVGKLVPRDTWGAWLAARPGSQRAFGRLLTRFPEFKIPVSVWSEASPDVMGELIKQGKKPAAHHQSSILRAWDNRLKAGHLKPSDVSTMRQAVRGGPGSRFAVDPEIFVQSNVGWMWGRAAAKGDYEPALRGAGAAFLNEVHDVRIPGVSGQWTPLAAQWFGQMRRLLNYNDYIASVDLRGWLVPRAMRDDDWNRWLQENRGVLAPSVAVEWRPGVALGGVIALGLLGSFVGRRSSYESSQPLLDERDDWKLALGVDDWKAWLLTHRESAVAFTEAVIRRGASNASIAMSITWNKALECYPGWLDDAPELKARLLVAIAQPLSVMLLNKRPSTAPEVGFSLLRVPNSGVNASVDTFTWPQLVCTLGKEVGIYESETPPAPVFEGKSPAQRSLLMEIGLLLQSPSWLEAIAQAVEKDLLLPADRERLERWRTLFMEAEQKGPDGQRRVLPSSCLLRLRGALLEQAISPAPVPHSKGPRF